jgi:hypothetical protein
MAVAERPSLLNHALEALVGPWIEPQSTVSWMEEPLSLVTSDPQASARGVARVVERRWPEHRGTLAAALSVHDGKQLGREIAGAVRTDVLEHLFTRFVGPRLIVIDGIDRFTDSRPTIPRHTIEDVFVHLFDAARAAGAAFCVSLAVHPAASGVNPRLASRLCAGIVVPASAPPVTPTTVNARLSMRRIQRAAARLHGITVDQLIGSARCRTIAAARSFAMYAARMLTGQSFAVIGRCFGNRDHTTAMHAIRVVGQRMAHDPVFAADVHRFLDRLTMPTGPLQSEKDALRGCCFDVDPVSGTPVPAGRHRP